VSSLRDQQEGRPRGFFLNKGPPMVKYVDDQE